jgi:hypothetical protein
MSIFDKVLGSDSGGFGVHPSLSVDSGRRSLSLLFVVFSAMMAGLIAYLAVAAVSDFYPFSRRVSDNLPPIDLAALERPTFVMKPPLYTASPCGYSGQVGELPCDSGFTYNLCTYFRYGTLVYDTEAQKPITSIHYGPWLGLSPENKPEIVTGTAEIPTNFYTGSVGLRQYEFVILKEIGQSSVQPNLNKIGGTGLDQDRFCPNTYFTNDYGFPGTAYLLKPPLVINRVLSDPLTVDNTLSLSLQTLSFLDLPADPKVWPH